MVDTGSRCLAVDADAAVTLANGLKDVFPDSIAKKAIGRKAGARGLRAILEEVMLDVMYEVPSNHSISECLINEDVIEKTEKPVLGFEKQSA